MEKDLKIELCADKPPMDLIYLADESEDMINEYLRSGECFVAKIDNEIIGVMVLMKTRPRMMEIMNIAVRPDFQNQGVATRMIHFAIQRAKDLNLSDLEIGTGNPGMIQLYLYQKCGFRIVGIEFDFFRRHCKEKIFENGIECRDMIRLRMELNPS